MVINKFALSNKAASSNKSISPAQLKIFSLEKQIFQDQSEQNYRQVSGLFAAQAVLENKDKFGTVHGLVAELGEVEEKYQTALETAAGSYLSALVVASDEVLIPVQTEYYALEGLSQLLETINLVRENLQPNLKVMGAVLTMYDRRNRLARQVVREMRDHFPGHVFDSVIPRSVRLAEAPSFGKSILSFDAFSKGARSYKNLAREIIERDKNSKKEFSV